jgi:hypothetical protein
MQQRRAGVPGIPFVSLTLYSRLLETSNLVCGNSAIQFAEIQQSSLRESSKLEWRPIP